MLIHVADKNQQNFKLLQAKMVHFILIFKTLIKFNLFKANGASRRYCR
jgi:hypothetical protein